MMSEGPNSRDESASDSGSSKFPWMVILGVTVVAVIVLALIFLPKGGGENQNNGEDGQLLQLTRTALAATESLETEEADQAWTSIFELAPEDRSVALNRALNRVLRVDRLSEQALDSTAEQEIRDKARATLASVAISAAESAVSDYETLAGKSADSDANADVIALWLKCRVELHEADLLFVSMTRRKQKEVFRTLVDAVNGELGKSPASVVLAGPLLRVLTSSEDPNDGLPKEMLEDARKTVTTLYERNPDNLFLAINAARLNIEAKNDQAKTLVARTLVMAAAIKPTLNQTLKPIGYTSDEIVAAISQAIDDGDWAKASQTMQFWFNVLNPTEIVKADRRRASPHPLDRLSFDALRRLSSEAESARPIAKGTGTIEFEAQSLESPVPTNVILPIDFDLNLQDDVVGMSDSGEIRLWKNDAGNWKADGSLKLDIQPSGLKVVDLFMVDESHPERLKSDQPKSESGTYRHNAFPSLIAFGEQGIRVVSIDGRNATAAADRLQLFDGSGLEDVTGVTALTAGDMEGDGDLDLVIATTEGIRVFINRGNRTFFETEHGATVDADDPATTLAIADLDRDLDLDVVTLHQKSGRVGLVENLLHLQFRFRHLSDIPAVPEATFLHVGDIDANVSWDLVVGGKDRRQIVFSQTADAGIWTVDRVETDEMAGCVSGAVGDFDNDSWLDLVVADGKAGTCVRLGPWGETPIKDAKTSSGTQFELANFDSDGKVDLVCLKAGVPTVLLNRTSTQGHHLSVRFRGIADNAANSGRVNHFGIGSVLELRFGPHYRSRIIRSPETHFGLDGFDQASSVRVILPNGLTQTIRDPSIDEVLEEEQKLKGSCPYLYAWDGEKFVFVTDCLWAAPLGLQVARGVVAKDRPWEYLKVDGSQIRPKDGKYEFRITEELWEVAYVDELALSVVDHPADVEIWTNEKVGPGSIATPTVFAFSPGDLLPLQKATDNRDRDVTDQLSRQDKTFVQGFDRKIRQGLCPPHWIDLDFGDVRLDEFSQKPSVYMVLTGWILPTDTSLNIQIDQNPELPPIEFPSVWVPDPSQPAGWKKAIPFMGFPGGKTKTIVVDVTDVINDEDPRLRVRTSAQIYWDSAKLAVQEKRPEVQIQDVELHSAEIDYHGFSRRIDGGPRQPESYDYQDPNLSAVWPPLRGSLTRFGSVTNLLRKWDDEMVVMSSGDEIRFRFVQPPKELPQGWRRDFVLHCVGWDKDADLNTLAGQTIGPLPSKEMASYPPTHADLDGSVSVEAANRSHRGRHQSFRSFWYRNGQPEPSRFVTPILSGSN